MTIPPPTREDFAVNIEQAYNCSHLLPDPGGEVVRTFIRLLEDARRERKEIAAAFVRMEKVANGSIAELKALRAAAEHWLSHCRDGKLSTAGHHCCERLFKEALGQS